MTCESVGVIGLGLLGSALAERLIGGGFDVAVFNRTREKSEPLLELGARWSDNPLAECPRVVICLYTTDVVESVLAQLKAGMRRNQILIDTTTGAPRQTEALGQRLAEQGVHYLESPIAASSQQTRSGQATAIVAGPKGTFDACRDIFDVIAGKSFHVGPAVGACGTHEVSQQPSAGSESSGTGRRLGLGRGHEYFTAQCLGGPQAGQRLLHCHGRERHKMVARDFTAQAKLSQHLKDVRLILEEAENNSIKLPVTELHRELLEQVENAGFGQDDNSAIIRAYDRSERSDEN